MAQLKVKTKISSMKRVTNCPDVHNKNLVKKSKKLKICCESATIMLLTSFMTMSCILLCWPLPCWPLPAPWTTVWRNWRNFTCRFFSMQLMKYWTSVSVTLQHRWGLSRNISVSVSASTTYYNWFSKTHAISNVTYLINPHTTLPQQGYSDWRWIACKIDALEHWII